ncbi:hypothetical protein ACQUFY_08350 [Robbsia andropogonis]|uniref:hypothetical protein n=1 Tax=Robbsia andropogonis TaxID=28092 RepID=UPI003D1B0296
MSNRSLTVMGDLFPCPSTFKCIRPKAPQHPDWRLSEITERVARMRCVHSVDLHVAMAKEIREHIDGYLKALGAQG